MTINNKKSKKPLFPRSLPWLVLFSLSTILLFFPFPGAARVPAVTEVMVTTHGDHQVLYARVEDLFNEDIEKAITTGMPILVSFTVDIYQVRAYWFDRLIARREVHHGLKYDVVKRVFQVSVNGEREADVFDDYQSARRAMSELNGVQVVPSGELKAGSEYYLRVKAKLERVRHSLVSRYLAYFIPWSGYETRWYVHKLGR